MKETRTAEFLRRPGMEYFFRNLILTAALSILVIVAAAGYGIYGVYQNHIIHDAQEDSANLCEALIAQNRDLLFTTGPGDRPLLSIAPGNLEVLDRRLRRDLAPFQIVKVKIYDAGGRILFSTEPRLIGEIDAGNPRLRRALQGRSDSHLERKESLRDLAEEEVLDADVVETYVPIGIEGKVVGAFEIYRDVTSYRRDIRAAAATSLIILVVILLLVAGIAFLFVRRTVRDLTEVQERLKEMATIDSLTGCLNRGIILARAREEISRFDRRREKDSAYALSFILLDIDHFKKINDTFGHLTGDQVLRETSERIRSSLREYDILGRFGGEEFLVVLPGTPLDGALATAERIRQAINRTPFVFREPLITVTASLGVTTTREDERDLTRILRRADESLYLAKERGRNAVASAEGATG